MAILLAALTYVLHLVSLPLGWGVMDPDVSGYDTPRPAEAAIGRNGTVAVLLAKASPDRWKLAASGTLLVVHPNGRSVLLRSAWIHDPRRYFSKYQPCSDIDEGCLEFAKVVVADDGSPFVTATQWFSGAYSGVENRAFVWSGRRWRLVPGASPFGGLGMPSEPSNVSIAAVEGLEEFAYIGDQKDGFPGEDLNIADTDPKLRDLSAVAFGATRLPLGLGNATAMRGPFVAGFDGGLGLMASQERAVALRWRCANAPSSAMRRCSRSTLGPGIAYGVDSRGEVVGDNQTFYNRDHPGEPTLWRNGKSVALATSGGAAYAISESGAIVGTLSDYLTCERCPSRGFVADANARRPHALPIDALVSNLEGRHVVAAFGVDDAGRILCYVAGGDKRRHLALLVPR